MNSSLDASPRGRSNIRPLLLALAGLVLAALLLPVSSARALEFCAQKRMVVVAHQDDDLIFENPSLLENIAAGDCVRTVFVTAGDAGLGTAYWHEREAGSRAAYAQMSGVPDTWTNTEPVVAGHTLHVATLNGKPTVSQVYLRLPNGGGSGAGYAATGFVSLPKLWRSKNPQPASLSPLSELTALDGSATYTYEGLLATLKGLISEFEPDVLSTQDFVHEFGSGDHYDHLVTAKLVQLANASYGREHELRSYMDYESKNFPVNVVEPELAKKLSAYYAYAAHDSNEACSSQIKCEEPFYVDYWAWLKRQIIISDTSVPGADAGSAQSVASKAAVTLDGSASSDPLGHALGYEWKQTGGTAVTLSSSTAVKPTFTAPSGPTTLTFSLVVKSSEASSEGASVTVSVAAPKFALKVIKSGNGSGTVTSSPSGINCGSECEASYEQGKEVTLTPSAAGGSEFKSWSGACTGTGTCKVTISAAKEVGAEFALEKHQLSIAKSGAGSGTVSSSPAGISCGSTCAANFDHGTEVTLSPAASGGSSFVKWTGACSGSGTCKVTMSAAKSVGAEFALIPKFALKVTRSGNGSGSVTSSPAGIECGVDCEQSYEEGTEVTLSPSPAAGSEFKAWTGACSGSGTCKVTISAAKEVGAEFALERHQLSVTRSGTGSGTVGSSPTGIECGATCSASFNHGTEVTLGQSPAGGSKFVKWTGSCSGSGTCKVTMSAAKSVGAEFALIPKFALKVTKSGNGSGTVTSGPAGINCGSECEASYEQGTEVTLSPSPAAGSEFKGWSGACTGTGACKVAISAAKEVGAEFALEHHQLSVTKSGTGSGGVTSAPIGIECGATCSASFNHGTEVTLSPAAAGGSSFVKWTGACTGSGACKVTMTAAKSVGAEFALIPKFALKVTRSGNGSGTVTSSPTGIECGVDCEQSYEQGTIVTLSPSPGTGSEFKGWGGACAGTGACQVTVSAAKEVSAEFALERHQLSVTESGAGSGTVSSSPAGISCGATCAASFDHGTEVTLSPAASGGSSFVKWTGACSGSGTCKVTMSAAKSVGAEFALIPKFALKVTRSGNGSGTVTSSPAGITCGAGCEASYEQGTEVTLSPSPAAGSEFKGWSGACTGTGACKVAISAAKEVGAEFALEKHQLSLAKSGTGSGTVSSSPVGISCGATCAASFDHGTEVTLSSNPSAGSSFVKWTGSCTGSGSCKVTMSAAKSVGAEFALIPKFALKVTRSGNGSGSVTSSPAGIECGVDCEQSYEEGTEVTLTPSPATGSEFKGWSGACTGSGTCQVTISAAKEVGAEFALEKHQLGVTKNGTGGGSVTSSPAGINCGATCSASFDHGTEVTLSPAAAGGSSFVKWTGACTGSGTCKVTMSAAKSVGVEFALIPKFALKVTKRGNGSGTVTSGPAGINCGSECEASYEQGTEVTLSPSPAAGSEFKGWTGACAGTGSCEVTISAAKDVGAEFALEKHQLSISRAGSGSGTVNSSPVGISCGATCSASFDHGTEVTLSATPAGGSSFVKWTGACSGSGTCNVTMTAAKSVGAEFAPIPKFALDVTTSGNGSGSVSSAPAGINCGVDCEESYEQGTEVTLTPSATAGSEFKGWGGACGGTGACKVTMSALREVDAEFALERHQLSIAKSGAGSGTVTSSPSGVNCGSTCAASFDHGTEVTLSPAAAGGSSFVKWTGACTGSGTCKVTMSAAKSVGVEFALIPKFALKVTKSGNGSGTVTSGPAGINCGSECEASYEQGTEVTLSPSPAAGSEFKGWMGACAGTGSCEVTISAAKDVGAEFALEKHQLSISRAGSGSGTVNSSPVGISCGATCSASFDHGTEVTLSPAAAGGSSFVQWTGSCTGSGTCKVTMSAAKSVGAEFVLIPKFALKVTKAGNGSGTVASSPAGIECGGDCEQSYEEGTEVTLTPSPATGSEFKGWSGACSGTGSCEVTISAAKEVGAEFALEKHQLSIAKSGAGSGTVSSSPARLDCGATCSASFDHGTTVTLSAAPAGGSSFVKWTGACTGTGSCNVTMSAAKSVGAEFALIPKFALEVTKSGNGGGAVTSSPAGIECGVDCEEAYELGKVVTLTPSAQSGSEFKGWSGACSGTGACEVTMSALREVGAEFALERHQLSVATGGSGSGTVTSSPAGISCGATCAASFDHGTAVALSATAKPGSFFVEWTGACTGSGVCDVTMSAAKSVGAEFSSVPVFALKLTKSGNGGGTVTSAPAGIGCGADCEQNYEEGTEVTLTPSPAAGSEFKGWSGACSGSGTCKVTIDAAREVDAEFALQRHRLTIAKAGAGSGTIASSPAGVECGATCAASFDHGTAVTLSANVGPDTAAVVWSGCDEVVGERCKVSMDADADVVATLNKLPDPPPSAPTTKLLKTKVDHRQGRVRFAFVANGSAIRFRCALARGRQKLTYKTCSSPITYRGLRPGSYVFKVKAVGLDGVDAAPVTKRFTVAAVPARRATER